MKRILLFLFFGLLISLTACKKREHDVIYELNQVGASSPAQQKDKLKTEEQYISILYANLFQKAISPNILSEIKKCIESIGDREVAHEVVISNFMKRADVMIPDDALMRADLDVFITETYRRYYIREPSIAERTYLKNYLLNNPQISAELVYFAFAISVEYQYY